MIIAGIDEVGRGPLAGPVVAAAVVLKPDFFDPCIQDSKKLSAAQREHAFDLIVSHAEAWSVVAVGHERIAALNIRNASLLAMQLALARIEDIKIDLVLVDGNVPINTSIPQRTVVGGDALHIQISAASILAKVYRDWLMQVLEVRYPGYGLAKHAGYPTAAHRAAIATLGPSVIHRKAFRGVKEYGGQRRSAISRYERANQSSTTASLPARSQLLAKAPGALRRALQRTPATPAGISDY
jgi:ribonuclease HII